MSERRPPVRLSQGNPRILPLLGVALLVVAGSFLVSVGLAAYLTPHDTLVHADAIVVISGGGTERELLGIRLYQEGWADRLVLSGAAMDPGSPSNAAQMQRDALAQGVPASAVLVEDRSLTTYQNAAGVRELLGRDARTIILVTSSYHQRRAARTFQAVFGDGVAVLSAPADVEYFQVWNWWQSERGRYLLASEYGKLLYTAFTGKYERDDP